MFTFSKMHSATYLIWCIHKFDSYFMIIRKTACLRFVSQLIRIIDYCIKYTC